jgi:EpsI family protein
MLVASLWLPRWELPRHERFVPVALPVEIDGWRMQRKLPVDETFLGSVRFTTYLYRSFARGRELILVFVGYDDRMRSDRSFLTRKNAFVDAGWRVEERRLLQLEAGERRRVESVLARSRQRRLLSHVWYADTGPWYTETLRALLALDRSPLRRRDAGRVVRISTPLGPGAEEVAPARARLRTFGPALETSLLARYAEVAPGAPGRPNLP